ncbi:MAG TPA: NAD-dependent epimerase/dehydratase family protein [Pirellulales bacterium]
MNLANSTILVTGGCGLIGSTLIDQLLAEDDVAEVRVIDNLSRGTRANLAAARDTGRVELFDRDIRDFTSIRPLFDGVDVVFHQAALRITACATHWRECQEVLVDGTYNVVEACVAAGVRRLVAASSASVYGLAKHFPTPEDHTLANNRTWYGAAKIANEALYRAFHEMTGLDYVALRYFNVYGPRMDTHGKYTEVLIRWLDCLDRGERPKIFGDGGQTMDFVYVGDVARANRLAAASEVTDQVFNVATGRETSLNELYQLVLAVTDRGGPPPEYLPERTVNPVRRRWAAVDRAKQLLSFEAQVSLEDGLRQLVEWRETMRSAECGMRSDV